MKKEKVVIILEAELYADDDDDIIDTIRDTFSMSLSHLVYQNLLVVSVIDENSDIRILSNEKS